MIEFTSKFISLLKRSNLKDYYAGEGISRIQVDNFVSKIAYIYEKIRNAIDYKDEHLLRKNAIQRILWRKLNLSLSNSILTDNLSNSLIKELIRAGYLENNLIPVAKIEEVNKIVEKYHILMNFSGIKRMTPEGTKLLKWLVSQAACEIEENLVPPIQHFALANYTFKVLGREIKIIDPKLSEDEKKLQIIIAIHRALIKSDEAMVHFLIWKFYYPDWEMADKEQVTVLAKKIRNFKALIERQATHYLGERLLRIFKKYSIVFHVLKEIITDKPAEAERIFNSPDELESKIRKNCDLLYKKARSKLRRSIFRVTVYIFITKMLLVLLLELPYERYIAHNVNYTPLLINGLFFPFLMVLIGFVITIPTKKNTDTIVKISKNVVFKGRIQTSDGVGATVRRKTLTSMFFNIFYFILFGLTFGLIIYLLALLSFTVFSMAIFILFLSLISFFGIKIRQGVRELMVTDKRENLLSFMLNLLSLPFLRIGYWFSVKFSKFNVFVFVFDFIIEAPLKIFLDVIEDWFAYLKEKKDEIYNQ